MTVREAIEQKRGDLIMPWLEIGMSPEPAISIPLNCVFIDDRGDVATITLADLAKCFE